MECRIVEIFIWVVDYQACYLHIDTYCFLTDSFLDNFTVLNCACGQKTENSRSELFAFCHHMSLYHLVTDLPILSFSCLIPPVSSTSIVDGVRWVMATQKYADVFLAAIVSSRYYVNSFSGLRALPHACCVPSRDCHAGS